jgi:hypothetical protein
MARIDGHGKLPASYSLFTGACWDRPMTAPPTDCCRLRHRVFSSFSDPLFRRAETDGTPVMVVMLGERQAAIPLPSLQREFAIAEDSDDGRMLALIARALDFVAALRIGDALPAEVLSGEASWEPSELHLQIAEARLQWQLVAWLNSGSAADAPQLDAEALVQVAEDPARKQQVQQAFAKAAEALGASSREAVIHMVEELARELAYIEALRDRLLNRLKSMADKLNRMAQTYRGDGSHLETLTQVRRLTAAALKQIGRRFDELDAHTGEVMAALRNADSQRDFIRSHRDWLYRSQRAWQSLLQEWDLAGTGFDEGMFLLLNRTYQFLAPRFMPVTEWASLTRPAAHRNETERRMVW